MSGHLILKIGSFSFSVILKEESTDDVEVIILTDHKTGEQKYINESDIDTVFHELSEIEN